jgi:hypothetical protein
MKFQNSSSNKLLNNSRVNKISSRLVLINTKIIRIKTIRREVGEMKIISFMKEEVIIEEDITEEIKEEVINKTNMIEINMIIITEEIKDIIINIK